jgi:hypothetical protein
MKTPTKRPPILYGAAALAVLSLIWSAYAITDLMHSGKFGLSVAIAGDIGWITVLWAEYKGVTIAGYRWAAPVAGWLIAVGVAYLLIIHGAEHSRSQAIAGPFVVLVGKIVWAFALAAMKDPAAPTPEQRAELHTVIRDTAHETAMLHARAQARIARIRAEASVTLARDEADFEITVERLDKRAELERRTPFALPAAKADQESTALDAATAEAIRSAERQARTDVAITALMHAVEPPQEPVAAEPRKQPPPSQPAGPVGKVVRDVTALFARAHAPVVYFLRNGTRVKIGTSQNLRRRITSLSLRREDVVRVEHGDQQYERSLHRRFQSLRVDETEWFELRGALAEYLGLAAEDSVVSVGPDPEEDTAPDTSGRSDNEPDTASGQNELTPGAEPVRSPDTQTDSPDPLAGIAQAASGPSDLVRSLAAHGVPMGDLVSEAVRLRPDMVADSIRRTAKRLGEGPYL